METKTTTIRGLLIDVLVIETVQTDAIGTLFYVATIVVKHRKTGAENTLARQELLAAVRLLPKPSNVTD